MKASGGTKEPLANWSPSSEFHWQMDTFKITLDKYRPELNITFLALHSA